IRPSPLDLGPGLEPIVVVLAVVTAGGLVRMRLLVDRRAIAHRRVPVVDALPERGVCRVVVVAELRVWRQPDVLRSGGERRGLARLALRRSLAEPLRDLRVDL